VSDHSSTAGEEIWVCRLGTVGYAQATRLQERVRAVRWQERIGDVLLLLEHPPVYTRGRRAEDAELAPADAFRRARGIELHDTDRGGRITYHGPGQLVGYPIMRVEDVLAHVRAIESALVGALALEGVDAHARVEDGADFTGVWVAERKIASIGVHVSRGVSTHGFALNVDADLEPFSWIVPCGLHGVQMTSLALELAGGSTASGRADDGNAANGQSGDGRAATAGNGALRERMRALVAGQFCSVHERTPRAISADELRELLEGEEGGEALEQSRVTAGSTGASA
jgi:lipoyl(octanoyl) transferase